MSLNWYFSPEVIPLLGRVLRGSLIRYHHGFCQHIWQGTLHFTVFHLGVHTWPPGELSDSADSLMKLVSQGGSLGLKLWKVVGDTSRLQGGTGSPWEA